MLVRGDRARLRAVFAHATPEDLRKMQAADAAEEGTPGLDDAAPAASAAAGATVTAPAGPPSVTSVLEAEAHVAWPPVSGKPVSFVYLRRREPASDGAAAAAGSTAGWTAWKLVGAVRGGSAQLVNLKPLSEYEVKVAASSDSTVAEALEATSAPPATFRTKRVLLSGQINVEGDRSKRVADRDSDASFELRGLPASCTRLVHAVVGLGRGKAAWEFEVTKVGSIDPAAGGDCKLGFGVATVPTSDKSASVVFAGFESSAELRTGSTVRAAEGDIKVGAVAAGSVVRVEADASARSAVLFLDGVRLGEITGLPAGTLHPAAKIVGGVPGLR